MKASVVVPTLNEEKTLRQMLESVRAQDTSHQIEIIVVDSYSTDKTQDISLELADLLMQEPPGIIAKARQKGSMAASGDVIVSTCADTIYDKKWLEELLRPIEEGKAIGTVGKVLPHEGNWIENFFLGCIHSPSSAITTALKIPLVAGESIAFTKKGFNEIGGYNTELITGEDTDLMGRLIKIGNVSYCHKSIAWLSTRRAREWGYGKYLWFHTTNYLQTAFLKKAHGTYEPIR